MVKTPTILLRAELALSVLAILSALAFALPALNGAHYFMLASEGLVLMAGVFGVIAGLGKFPSGPAMAATCVAGSVFLGGAMGGLETQVLPSFRGGDGLFRAATFSRLALGMLLALVAALMILSRTPGESIKRLVWASVAFAPVAALLAAWKMGAINSLSQSIPEVAFQVLTLIAGLLAIVLVSIGAHCAIRAFEIGVKAADSASENPAG